MSFIWVFVFCDKDVMIVVGWNVKMWSVSDEVENFCILWW